MPPERERPKGDGSTGVNVTGLEDSRKGAWSKGGRARTAQTLTLNSARKKDRKAMPNVREAGNVMGEKKGGRSKVGSWGVGGLWTRPRPRTQKICEFVVEIDAARLCPGAA